MSFKEKFKFKFKFKNKKQKVGAIVGVVLLLGGGFYFLRKSKINDGIDAMTDFVETYSIPDSEKIFINGSIIPKESKEISVEAGYEVSSVNVSNGQSVSQGDTLFTAKSDEVLSQISDLEQQVKDLKSQGSSDSEGASSINSEVSKLNSEIKKLKNKSTKTTYAPFSGKVYINNDTSGSEGESASYMTIEGNEYYMKGQVSEQDLPKLSQDIGVEIYVFATEGKLTGKISSISQRPVSGGENTGETGNSSLSYYEVSVEFDSQDNLTNGFHIQASVEVANENPKVPTSALKEDENGYFVYKIVDGSLVKQSVEVENKTDDYAVLKSGLAEKDMIIKVPTDEMKEGDQVPVDSMSIEESVEGDQVRNITDEKVGM